jgi:Rrf2 family protein
MKLSTRTRYAIRAILELAENFGRGPLQTRVIAKHQDISIKYLEQLMSLLKSADLVRSVRGAKGGYMLSKPPEKIKLSDVFVIFEGPVVTVECVANENYCARAVDCIARQVWSEVQRAVKNVLQSMTLQDAIDKGREGQLANYQI